VGTLEEAFPTLRPRLRLSSSFEDATWRHGKQRVEGLRPRREISPDAPAKGEPVDVIFPARASGPVVAEGEGVRVVLRPRGARPVRARVVDGKLAYLGVYPETDSLHVVDDEWTEEYLYLRSADAPVRFEYDVLETHGASSVLIEGGQVSFRNAEDQGLVILGPVVVDAAGRRSATAARWELGEEAGRLVLHLDPTGLEYPLVVDPTWVATGSLNLARGFGVGILLQNGKVLEMGREAQAELYDIATGTWKPTGAGWPGHGYFAAVLLRDGKVLTIGGEDITATTTLAECSLYDPVADTWILTASMSTPRKNHTATLLDDGRVLVVGGEDAGMLDTAEIYDPATATWNSTNSLTAGKKTRHTATLLRDGRVMVAGGWSSTGITPVTEIYDPGPGTWTRVADLQTERMEHSATLLPDGTVLVAGGQDGVFQPLTSAEIFDPFAGPPTWTTSPANLAVARYDHSATLLPNGQVLVVGGRAVSPLSTVEVYDPGLPPTFTAGPNISTVRWLHSATMLPDGRVLVAGGFNTTVALATAELWDNDIPTWTGAPAVPNMNAARYDNTATLLRDGRVLVAGGYQEDTAEVFDPKAGPPPTWTPTLNDMSRQRWRHSATLLLDGRVLVAGSRANSAAEGTADLYDPGANTWSATGDLNFGRSMHTATLLPNGEVLIAGGYTNTNAVYRSAELFDPWTETWTPTTSLIAFRVLHAATLLRDGRVLVTGGFDGSVLNTAELYEPSGGTWTLTAGTMTQPRDGHTSTLLPSGKVLIVGGTVSRNFTPTGNLNVAHDSDFTATLLTNGRVLVVGGSANPQSAEVYDPVTGTWTVAPSTIGERAAHAASILPDGRVLVAGSLPIGPTAEIYDVGRGEDPTWRPVLATVTDPLVDGAPLVASGSQFQGISEASGGLGYMNSSSNYPLVQVRRLDNEDVHWLFVDPSAGWLDTKFTSLPLAGLAPGPALVTVFTNGIPSDSRLVTSGCTPPVITTQPTDLNVCLGAPAVFSVGTSASLPSFEWRKGGTPLVDGPPISGVSTSTLTINPTALTDAGTYDVVVSTCSTTTTLSAPAVLTVSNAPNLSSVDVTLTMPPDTVCTTCVGGTITESHTDGGVVTHEWGYRLTSGGPTVAWMPGKTGPTYEINGSDFPGPGTYYVAVRTTPACGLPLESSSDVPVTVVLSPPGDDVEFFTVTSRSTQNVLEWVNPLGFGTVRILYNEGVTCTFPTDPLGPGTLLPVPAGTPGARDGIPHNGLTNGRTYCYTIFTDQGGGAYSGGRSNSGRPMDTSGPVKWAFSTGVFSLTAPTVGYTNVIATSNDNVVHAMGRGLGGGEWPLPWLPKPVDGPIQSRSPLVPITVNGAYPVLYLGTQAGSVYAIDGTNGGAAPMAPWFPNPESTSIAPEVQAAPAGMFTAFGGNYDYLLVGTRETDSAFVALNPQDGMELGRWDNGGSGIGAISGMAVVDYPTDTVYFTSLDHSGGSPTLWALRLGAGPVFTPAWGAPRALGDITSSPVLMDDRVYVGSPVFGGTLYSIDAATGMGPDRTYPHNNGQVKGFVFPDRSSGDLYFATDDFVWALNDDGSTISNKYPPAGISLGGGVVPTSAVLFIPGSHYVYVGGSDGRLYEIDVLGGVPIIKSVRLGDGLATVGSPTLDWSNSLIHVGTEAGVFYAVEIPFVP
jgi:hypothetical protein